MRPVSTTGDVGWFVERWNYRNYRRLTDEAWLRTLLGSVQGRSEIPMPGFPSAEIQSSFVGQSNQDAINEAWRFYKLMSDRWKKYGLRIGSRSHVLDFGCGWGRFARMFLRDVPASHIYCADTSDGALDICRETGVPGNMVRLEPMPPSVLPSARFDIVFAYSVFSHLSPKAHLAWRTELARVVKPNGLVFITTQARWFLDECRRYREHPDQISLRWHQKLANSFVDYENSVRQYDLGEFLFAADEKSAPLPDEAQTRARPMGNPELGRELYGEAIVPGPFFESEWSDGSGFELLDFLADRSLCEQAIAIIRRR
jgi:ubiquinone/menaquinone biosynthesis C-methylase UbiE